MVFYNILGRKKILGLSAWSIWSRMPHIHVITKGNLNVTPTAIHKLSEYQSASVNTRWNVPEDTELLSASRERARAWFPSAVFARLECTRRPSPRSGYLQPVRPFSVPCPLVLFNDLFCLCFCFALLIRCSGFFLAFSQVTCSTYLRRHTTAHVTCNIFPCTPYSKARLTKFHDPLITPVLPVIQFFQLHKTLLLRQVTVTET